MRSTFKDPKAELTEILSWLRQEAQTGLDAAKEQVPVVVRETVAYHRIKDTAISGAALLAGTLALSLLVRYVKRERAKKYPDIGEEVIPWAIGSGVLFLVGAIFSVFAAKAWFAPSLVVLDYIRGLL